jgi:phage terminase large subunit-like protein
VDAKLEVLKKCANDLLFFGKTISPASFKYSSPEFHKELSSILMNRSNIQTLIEAPRGTAKSTLTRLFVMHHYIFDPGDKVIVIQSKTLREAKRRLWKIKDTIEYNQTYRDLFGYHGEQTASAWNQDYIKFKFNGNYVTIIPAGTGQQIRGLLEGDTRLTLYLLDDPDDEDNTKTIDATVDNFSKFIGGVACLDRISNGRVIVIGTPVGEGCIVARLRDATGWVTKNYAAYDEETKECLWEEMYDAEWLDNKKKELEEQGMLWKFYSEYMCQLKGKDDQIFKPDNFKWWDGGIELGDGYEHYLIVKEKKTSGGVITEFEPPLRIPIYTFMGVDPAFSMSPKADFTVILNVAIDKDWNIYVLPYIRGRMLTSELIDRIIDQHIKYKPMKTTIESVAAQDTIRQALKNLDGIYISGVATKTPQPKDSKNKRYIDVLEDLHRRGKIHLHYTNQRLKDEMIMHPSPSGHDDTIDGLYWAVKKAHPPEHEIEVKKEVSNRDFFNVGINRKPSNWVR